MKQTWYKKWWVWTLIGLGLSLSTLITLFNFEVKRITKQIEVEGIKTNTFTTQSSYGPLPTFPTNGVTVNVITTDDPYDGPLDAKVTVVEFGDFQCPFCKQEFPILRELASKYNDRVRFIWRDFPISSIHPEAQLAAEAGECANEQESFWLFHDILFLNQENLSKKDLLLYASKIGLNTQQFTQCISSNKYKKEVLADIQDGISAGVVGTPTIFINNRPFNGALPKRILQQLIDDELALYDLN